MTESEKWEHGCRADKVRNDFVIPSLLDHIEQKKPMKILDVGSGTAYVARKIDSMLNYTPQWTIIDTSKERIDFAISKFLTNSEVNFKINSFADISKSKLQFDAILLLFTLLEMEFNEKLCKQLNATLNKKGVTYIVMPNSLEDVFKAAQEDYNILFDYLNDVCKLNKTNKFTNETYPFNAHRFEYIIQCMLNSGHELIHMKNEKFNNKETYLLAFQKVSY